jgi:hypothetical protein
MKLIDELDLLINLILINKQLDELDEQLEKT